VLFSEDALRERVRQLGEQISRDYAGREVHLICVLRGAALFVADLIRAISLPHSLDFISISSYGSGTRSTGVVRIVKDLEDPLEGRHVLVIEDIIDSGLTLSYLVNLLRDRNPVTLEICTLLDKPSARKTSVQPRYVGFEVPEAFVVGYGLDYNQGYRGLPYIGILKPDVYAGG
jgi:hypoxanthine phosphoribosyltransferase